VLNDLELLHDALEEDLDLDEARNLELNVDTDVAECNSSMTEMPDDEKEILAMTHVLWINTMPSESVESDRNLVFRVTDQHLLRIKEHGIATKTETAFI